MKDFKSLASFGAFVGTVLPIAVLVEAHRGLKICAEIIETTARSELGHYQDAVGPHPAWPELAEATQTERQRLGFTPNDPLLRTGELRDSIVHEVKGLEAVVGSKLDIAEYQEFGTDRIPPRPFLGPAALLTQKKVVEVIGAHAVAGLSGGRRLAPELGYDTET